MNATTPDLTAAAVRDELKRELCTEQGVITAGFVVATEGAHVVVAIEQPILDRTAYLMPTKKMDAAEMLWQLMECEHVLLGAGYTVTRDGDELRVTA